MLRAVLIETFEPDEQALRRRLAALGEPDEWRLESRGERYLLWLEASAASERLCAALLACGWLRRLDFAVSAG